MADQAINALSTKTAPETSDQLLLVGAGEPQLIDYDKLADAILNKITSKNYALDAGTMTLTAALNKLNSDSGKMYVAYNNSDLNKLYDLNQIQSARIYVCVPGTHNIPEQETGFLIVIKYDNNSKMQIYMSLTKNIYIRNNNSEWTKL